jgi:phage shock protein PspC (stress-responsive transcriptional regulator)
VCGGIAEWRGWNPMLVRVLFALIALFPTIPGILVYGALWLLIPSDRGDVFRSSSGRPPGAAR